MSPLQVVYNEIRKLCVDLYGENVVFDNIPGEVPYPYIQLGDQSSQNVREHKDNIDRNTQVVLHVWHNDWDQRGELSHMMFEIEEAIIAKYGSRGELVNSSIMPDDTTGSMLAHGILDLSIRV